MLVFLTCFVNYCPSNLLSGSSLSLSTGQFFYITTFGIAVYSFYALAYPAMGGGEGVFLLVQMISTWLSVVKRKGGQHPAERLYSLLTE